MLPDSAKKNLRKFEYVFIIALIVVIPLLFFKSSITGFIASDAQRQILNVNFADSQTLNLKSSSGEPFYISSFSISGEITGEGDVAVYLKQGDARSLVYTNVGQIKKTPLITGQATGTPVASADVAESGGLLLEEGAKLSWPGDLGENSASGSVTAVCMDSCYLSPDDFTASTFELQVFVEPGTTFKLQEIFYTIG